MSTITMLPRTGTTALEPPKVGQSLQALRRAQGLSLEELSRRAGVSKSMLSQIERNQANPTVAVVWRLANALHVEMGQLLGHAERDAPPPIERMAAHTTPSMSSPDTLCQLRILGPIEMAGQFEWYELLVQPAGALDSEPHERGAREHLTVLTGQLQVCSGGATLNLGPGETARYAADVPHLIRNTTQRAARALLVVMQP